MKLLSIEHPEKIEFSINENGHREWRLSPIIAEYDLTPEESDSFHHSVNMASARQAREKSYFHYIWKLRFEMCRRLLALFYRSSPHFLFGLFHKRL